MSRLAAGLLLLAVAFGLGWLFGRVQLQELRAKDKAEIAARGQSIAQLGQRAAALRDSLNHQAPAVARLVTRWRTAPGQVDTLPGRVDTIPVVRQILALGDSLADACTQALGTCDRLHRVEQARADSAVAQAAAWKRVARGPLVGAYLAGAWRLDLGAPEVGGGLTIGRTWQVFVDGRAWVRHDATRAVQGDARVGVRRRF